MQHCSPLNLADIEADRAARARLSARELKGNKHSVGVAGRAPGKLIGMFLSGKHFVRKLGLGQREQK